MLVQKYECDICGYPLAEMEGDKNPVIIRSFKNLKIKHSKYQICVFCVEEITKKVNARRNKMKRSKTK